MKLLCYIFALFVLSLTAKPCCADSDCGAKISLTKNTPGQSSSKDKDCQGCSPFFACGSCSGFTVTKPNDHTLLMIPEMLVKPTIAYHKPYIEDVTLAIWQPPQLG